MLILLTHGGCDSHVRYNQGFKLVFLEFGLGLSLAIQIHVNPTMMLFTRIISFQVLIFSFQSNVIKIMN